ncbi:MAG: zinc ribbon domain-containing protein [Deltaproteobacteria bacterium]|nr:zinc ribbon domain-containing protein [Deltaproteobacteria bacterium]
MSVKCTKCGTINNDGEIICSSCNFPLGGKSPNKTMMFGKAPVIPGVTAPAAVQSNTTQQANVNVAKPVTVAQPVVSPKPVAVAKPASNAGGQNLATNKTMIGAAPVNLDQLKEEAAAKTAAAPMIKMAVPKVSAPPENVTAGVNPNKTMMGMPAVDSNEIQKAVEAAKQAAAAKADAKQEQQYTNQPAKAPAPAPAASPAPVKETPVQQSKHEDTSYEDEYDNHSDVPKKSKNIIIIGAAAIVIVMLFAVIFFAFIFKGTPDFQSQIVPSPSGDNLTVILTINDKEATSISMGDQSIPLSGGIAQFLLPENRMALGKNLIEFNVVKKDGSKESYKFPVTLRHKISTDLSSLESENPLIKIKFEVIEGYSILVEKSECKMENNVCTFELPLKSIVENSKNKTDDGYKYTINFTLKGTDGTSESGQKSILIPITELQLDRPSNGAVVDSDEIIITGKSETDAIITVNGKTVSSTAAGFGTSLDLDKAGPFKIIVKAKVKDKAPAIKEILVTKVDSLEPFIKSWSEDIDPKFDYPKLSRNTVVYTGKKIKIEGRIVNISTANGITAFLMYIDKGCPKGGKCAAYVAFKGETEAGLQSMVNVYGTVRGTRDVDFAGGKKKTLPAIDAKFVTTSSSKTK